MSRYQMTSKKFLDQVELKELEAILKAKQKSHTFKTLILEVALRCGARASELVGVPEAGVSPNKWKKHGLRLFDLNPRHKAILITGLKGSDDREIPLPEDLFDRLYAFAKSEATKTQGDDRVFKISLRRFQDIWYSLRPVAKPLHCLRHTFAMYVLDKTEKNIHVTRAALGHRNIQNTMVYADYRYKTDELRKLIW